MRKKSGPAKEPAEKIVKDIRRMTRRKFSAEEKIRIVLEGLRGEESIAELCRREGIVQNLYYRWSKDFLEAGKKRLAGDTARAATSDEVKDLRREASSAHPASSLSLSDRNNAVLSVVRSLIFVCVIHRHTTQHPPVHTSRSDQDRGVHLASCTHIGPKRLSMLYEDFSIDHATFSVPDRSFSVARTLSQRHRRVGSAQEASKYVGSD